MEHRVASHVIWLSSIRAYWAPAKSSNASKYHHTAKSEQSSRSDLRLFAKP